jgi:hypothetical protein
VNGISDIEGKAARVAASECGQRVSFNDEGRSAADTAATTAVIRVHSCQFVVKVR